MPFERTGTLTRAAPLQRAAEDGRTEHAYWPRNAEEEDPEHAAHLGLIYAQ